MTRAAVYQLNLSPIYLVNRDPEETSQVINDFPNVNLKPLISVDQARGVIADPEIPHHLCVL
jgi:hypothetical protein